MTTPGPWEARDGRVYAGPLCVATMIERHDANARLIAAAPDLLAICRDAASWCREYATHNELDTGAAMLADDLKKAISAASGPTFVTSYGNETEGHAE